MATIKDCLQRSAELNHISDSARLDTEILLAKAVDKPRTFLYTWADKSLEPPQLAQFEQWFSRRKQGEPIAYILGEKEFWSLSLKTDSSTLIPRPDTELLVETVLKLLPKTKQTILDLGTGTGAIALALASERPAWDILAIDESPKAVNLAIENCRQLNLTNVSINRSNWFANVSGKFNAIVCNPPYIAEDDIHLQQGDVVFEPRSALVANDKGLADLHLIIQQAPNYLAPSGWLAMEHGFQQGQPVREYLKNKGYINIDTLTDIAGNERVSIAQTLSTHDE